ncbi:Zinc carboxypeptidase [Chitinophaga terrae (ex Kim and Jung 2007)]|uniref:Zinc carboxypeptidase n=2 Tax=Chitinophaga terrae (ex Kim and Jung 2007) TaxID=408074 RepID=A0A1H4FPJ3_9BACT|nr:M14 metallopeptidase family protein [Chitinophaga terrae (ex Kim and Jung 2007)]GEP92618.1 peptidase [Chitinophaga terrae (ex Kim and Jung 2007)]SEA99007.1 Zinc carboxypeptidase [Chitinophaga terrae (ex Kim and Jung 2007)]
MMINSKFLRLLALLLATVAVAWAQVPSPEEHFGFKIGDDYKLANYTQTEAYFKKLSASDRTRLVDIGLTEEGRRQYMLIISSPENIRKLDQYKSISQQLARAEDLSADQAKQLSETGKAVVWIDGGLHATEVVGTHQLIETMWQLVSRTDPETLRILDNVIILCTHANPDGQELVSNWYMRETDTAKRNMSIPRLYEKYVGHDNNRDFYMMNMKESQHISEQLFVEWLPQIMYNHHQRGPAGSVLAGPPYRDPFNYVYDPLIVTSIDAVGAAMNNRLNTEGKPGYTQRAGSQFSTWWNGGLRTTPYFHNMVGLLTEIIGGPTPENVPLVPDRLIPNGATPNPVTPQKWHFRQSIDYSVSLNYAVLDYAARYRSTLLYNIYQMGANAIAKGNRDNWTFYPRYIDSIKALNKRSQKPGTNNTGEGGDFSFGREDTIPAKFYSAVLRSPSLRDARGYIIPADQADFPTAVRFINALIRSGISVHKATAAFTVNGKQYPAGSYIVKTAQAFRPHVIDMFEPQDHPNDFQYEGGPPIRPYDAAGWTLAFQMGVKFDRILEGFDGPFEKLPYGQIQQPPAATFAASRNGYLLSPAANNTFIAVNELLKAGVKVSKTTKGEFYVPASARSGAVLGKLAAEYGVVAKEADARPADSRNISPARIAIWNTYGGSIPSGWISWLMEQYGFSYEFIYPAAIDAGNLRKKYDLIIFPGGAIPDTAKKKPRSGYEPKIPKASELPPEYRSWLGKITADTSIPQLKKFMEEGGEIVTIGSSANIVYHLGLPVNNALVERTAKGEIKPLSGTKYYIPGSLLTADFDTTAIENAGMPARNDVYFDRSPVFTLQPGATGIKKLIWFSGDRPLHSGWAWGQQYLKDGIAAFSAPIGKGKLLVFGPEITFRGQSHSTFRLLFNQLYK